MSWPVDLVLDTTCPIYMKEPRNHWGKHAKQFLKGLVENGASNSVHNFLLDLTWWPFLTPLTHLKRSVEIIKTIILTRLKLLHDDWMENVVFINHKAFYNLCFDPRGPTYKTSLEIIKTNTWQCLMMNGGKMWPPECSKGVLVFDSKYTESKRQTFWQSFMVWDNLINKVNVNRHKTTDIQQSQQPTLKHLRSGELKKMKFISFKSAVQTS